MLPDLEELLSLDLLTLREHTELAGDVFRVTREGARGVEFTARLDDLMAASPALRSVGDARA